MIIIARGVIDDVVKRFIGQKKSGKGNNTMPPVEVCLFETTDSYEQFAVKTLGLDRDAIAGKIAEREQARTSKDWTRADALRDELLAMHVEVRDTPEGTAWKVVR